MSHIWFQNCCKTGGQYSVKQIFPTPPNNVTPLVWVIQVNILYLHHPRKQHTQILRIVEFTNLCLHSISCTTIVQYYYVRISYIFCTVLSQTMYHLHFFFLLLICVYEWHYFAL